MNNTEIKSEINEKIKGIQKEIPKEIVKEKPIEKPKIIDEPIIEKQEIKKSGFGEFLNKKNKQEIKKPEIAIQKEIIKEIPIKIEEKLPVQIICKSCKQSRSKNLFISPATGKPLKTCCDCRAKQSIKKPSQIQDILGQPNGNSNKDFLDDLIKKAESAEGALFDKSATIKKLRESGVEGDLDKLSDEEIKKKRRETAKSIMEKLSKLDKVMFDMVDVSAGVIEETTKTILPRKMVNDGYSLDGLSKNLSLYEGPIRDVFIELSEEDPEYFKQLLSPINRLKFFGALVLAKTVITNVKEAKKKNNIEIEEL